MENTQDLNSNFTWEMVQLENLSTITETVKDVNPKVDLIYVLDYGQGRARREILRNISFSITIQFMYPVLVFCFIYLAIAVLIALLKLHHCVLFIFLCPSRSSASRFICLVSSLEHLFRYAMVAGGLETNDDWRRGEGWECLQKHCKRSINKGFVSISTIGLWLKRQFQLCL